MQIVIEIDEKRYKDIQRIAEVQLESNHFKTAEQIIANGVPIPKGHGKIGDLDTLRALMQDEIIRHDLNEYGCYGLVNRAQTIIEADKTESEE